MNGWNLLGIALDVSLLISVVILIVGMFRKMSEREEAENDDTEE